MIYLIKLWLSHKREERERRLEAAEKFAEFMDTYFSAPTQRELYLQAFNNHYEKDKQRRVA